MNKNQWIIEIKKRSNTKVEELEKIDRKNDFFLKQGDFVKV